MVIIPICYSLVYLEAYSELVSDRKEADREGRPRWGVGEDHVGTGGVMIRKYGPSVSLVGASHWTSGRVQEEGGITVGWDSS